MNISEKNKNISSRVFPRGKVRAEILKKLVEMGDKDIYDFAKEESKGEDLDAIYADMDIEITADLDVTISPDGTNWEDVEFKVEDVSLTVHFSNDKEFSIEMAKYKDLDKWLEDDINGLAQENLGEMVKHVQTPPED